MPIETDMANRVNLKNIAFIRYYLPSMKYPINILLCKTWIVNNQKKNINNLIFVGNRIEIFKYVWYNN